MTDMSDDSRGHRLNDPASVTDTSDDTVGQVEAGGWMTVPQAALHYRKSTKTIERWVDAGRLQKHPTARPVEVWVPGAGAGGSASDMSDDTVGPDERAVALAERVSDAVGRQVVPILAALERSEERARLLERENGTLTERVAGLERDLATVQQVSDADRQRLSTELAAARAELAIAHAPRSSAPGSVPVVSPGPSPAWWRRWRRWPAIGGTVLVLGSSCQTPVPTKHAGGCSLAQSALDDVAAISPPPGATIWPNVDALLDVVSKAC